MATLKIYRCSTMGTLTISKCNKEDDLELVVEDVNAICAAFNTGTINASLVSTFNAQWDDQWQSSLILTTRGFVYVININVALQMAAVSLNSFVAGRGIASITEF